MHPHASRRRPPPTPLHGIALFLDVDGTLLGFADRPQDVRVPAGLTDSLLALSRRFGGALALVSGRQIAVLDTLFAPLRLPAAGLHGLERRHAELQQPSVSPVADGTLAVAKADAVAALSMCTGALIEDKGAAFALHWRQARDPRQAAIVAHGIADRLLARLPGYRLQAGDHVLELRPDAADKGSAIAAFLQESPFRGRRPVFVGDDLTDESGFMTVNRHDGISVLVGDRADSAANHGLPDIASVHAWLESLR